MKPSPLEAVSSEPVHRISELDLSPHELGPGAVLAKKYRLTRPTGSGGMGTVWAAINLSTAAEVAIKVLLPEHAGYEEAVERFRHEAQATGQLAHRGIVRIFDLIEFGVSAGSIAIVMELLHGRTLATLLDEREKLSPQQALEVVLPVLSALSHAHAAGVVHRDLKPDNVFLAVDPDGLVTPKILDFGIAKLCPANRGAVTGDGRTVGTPGYMSPEQARGLATVDHRSDLFNMGILLYEMLSGRNPFACDENLQSVVALLEREPEPIEGISRELWRVIHKVLEKEPARRFANAAQLAAALRAACGLRGSWPTPPFGVDSTLPISSAPVVIQADGCVEENRPGRSIRPSARRTAASRSRSAYAGGALVGAAVVAAFFTMAVNTRSRAALRDDTSSRRVSASEQALALSARGSSAAPTDAPTEAIMKPEAIVDTALRAPSASNDAAVDDAVRPVSPALKPVTPKPAPSVVAAATRAAPKALSSIVRDPGF